MNAPALSAAHLSKVYPVEGESVVALEDVSLDVPEGSITGVLGESGAGKSTLLRLLAGLEEPTGGSLLLNGSEVPTGQPARDQVRRARVGRLVPAADLPTRLTVREQILFQLWLAGQGASSERAQKVATALGLTDSLDVPVGDLDQEAQQLIAVAVACALPRVVLVDGLGGRFPASVLAPLRLAVSELGATVIFSTEDQELLDYADHAVYLGDSLVLEGAVLPQTLDAMAPVPPLPPEISRVVSEAEAILRNLPGPIPDAGQEED